MIKNYLKIAFRNLARHKGYSLINIAGLAVGMTACILILLWVQDELSYDRFHVNADRLFQVVDYEKYSTGEEITFTMNPAPLATVMKEEYPEIEEVTRFRGVRDFVVRYNDKSFEGNMLVFTDASTFTMFSFPFLKGNAETALSDPYSIVITEKTAEKYFGVEDPLGKTLLIDNRVSFTITGVLRNLPHNSHLQFELAAPFQTIKEFGHDPETWDSFAHTHYVLLNENADANVVSEKLTGVIKQHVDDAIATVFLRPLKDIHLYSGSTWGGGTGDVRYVIMFSLIAGLVLLLACINFMNLATARAGNRAKEVGLRKVVGARRKEIMLQFYGESILFTCISLILAILIAELTLPAFNQIAGKQLDFDFFANQTILLMLLGVAVITGLIAGSYPALLLSSFETVRVLKGSLRSGVKSGVFRKLLVCVQFVVTIALLIAAVTVSRQLQYFQNHKLGFNEEQILCINLYGNLNQRAEWLKNELKKNPDVQSISAVFTPPSGARHSTTLRDWEGRDSEDQFLVYLNFTDFDYLEVLGLEMVEGRFLSADFLAVDTTESVIVNETAVKLLGMDSPLGKEVLGSRIVGVMKDYHFSSLHDNIGPQLIFYAPERADYLMVKISSTDVAGTLKLIESQWREIIPEFPFECTFLDERIDRMYRNERRVGDTMNAFTILALLVACLGLVGLSSFAAEQRTKEIGIRKVLGATIPNIVQLLSKEFLFVIVLANVIAWPLAYYFMSRWLENFAYRIELSVWQFLAAGIAALLVALFTVSFQAVRAAVSNPVESLRYE